MAEGQDERASSAFSGRLPLGNRAALLVVDVVMAYLTPGSPLYDPRFTVALASNVRLAAAAREAGLPTFFTNVVYQPGGMDGGLFYRKVPALGVFDRGSPLGDFPLELRPSAGDVVVSKQYASAFFGTSLASTLLSFRIDSLLITGFSTSGCVRATALDALQHGFVPYVVGDACGDRDHSPHEAALFDLQTKYAELINENEAVGILQRQMPLNNKSAD
jgi:maleamate amidohydrolase